MFYAITKMITLKKEEEKNLRMQGSFKNKN